MKCQNIFFKMSSQIHSVLTFVKHLDDFISELKLNFPVFCKDLNLSHKFPSKESRIKNEVNNNSKTNQS